MTEQQKLWFDELVKDRTDSANTLEKPSMRGIKNSVVEKYSDQAHFIYELLQNANDAKATEAVFQLTQEGLYFRHNGTVGFTVSNPKTEDNDKENNTLGHINSITAIANSNKTAAAIGKFGVGFKAVFQYTETPHIYDRNLKFKITRFIVPVKLTEDLSDRKEDETVFYFPFDKKEMPKEKAHEDILGKLKKLIYPTLFLSTLQDVKWESQEQKGEYVKNIIQSEERKTLFYDKIELYQQINATQPNKQTLLLFRRIKQAQDLAYSIGYFVNEENKLIPKDMRAFCFFPTTEVTNLNFILHAPFLLTDSREGIKRFEDYNVEMVNLLAQLAADSLLILKDLKLLDDEILKIIPYKKPSEDDFFKPFYNAIKRKFETEELLPAKGGGYAKKDNAYWASVSKLTDLFSNKQLTDILKEEDTQKWVFASKGRDEVSRTDKELLEYIDAITNIWLDEAKLLIGKPYEKKYKFVNLFPNNLDENKAQPQGIESEFIEKQNDKWLLSFYEWISETDKRKNIAKEKPFFLNQERKAVSAYDDDDKLILFFPDNDGDGYETLNTELFNKGGKQLFEKFGIREHTVADGIETAIENFKNTGLEPESFFAKTFKYFKNECPQNEIDDFISQIEDLSFIPYCCKNGDSSESHGTDLFYPTEKLLAFYEQKTDTKFVNLKNLREKYSDNDHKTLDSFLNKLGVTDKDPTLKDEVYNIILPQYEQKGRPDNNTIEQGAKYLKTLLEYYQECPNNEIDFFARKLANLPIVLCTSSNEPQKRYWDKPINLYYPTQSLRSYFETKPNTKFIHLEDYHTLITEEKEQKILKDFLLKLGVSELPKIIEDNKNTYYEEQKIFTLEWCESFIKEIDTLDKSLIMWYLLSTISFKELQKLQKCKMRERPDGRYNFTEQYFESTDLKRLKNEKWLFTTNGTCVAPTEITIDELAEGYEKNEDLKLLLGFKPSVTLTKDQQIAQNFDSVEDAVLAKKLLEEYKAKQNTPPTQENRVGTPTNFNNKPNSTNSDLGSIEQPKTPIQGKVINDLETLEKEYTPPKEKANQSKNTTRNLESETSIDEDEMLAAIKKEQAEIKKNRIDLVEKINNSEKYSYEWFKAYLKLLTTYGEKQDKTTQKSITFQGIKPYKTDNKYFLLFGASRYISPEIESAEDFKITLFFKNETKENIVVEGVSKKGQDLLIYCRESLPTNILSRLSNVFKVEINFTPTIDLLDRLYKAFTNNNYIDEWQDIKEKMPSLNYIYGPPGTGKTTTLCNNIREILEETNYDAKILVLTPTNKAADVVCKKLKDDSDSEISVVRLSRPTDPELEETGIYHDVLEAQTMKGINVVASTIHRLPYFDIQQEGLLFQYPWDYVIFDESSMIGLHYITFALMSLFKLNEKVIFTVAGDPKQIPPVIDVNDSELENFEFQDENIYKMMELESFKTDEQVIRDIDTIQNLAVQYRSVPQIGQLFSELSYASLLKHDRATNRKESKELPEKIKRLISSNVTFIDIPLDKNNSIYKINKLFYSSYHIYSTILVTEVIKYFDNEVNNGNWTIGLIAPYKAQAVLLNKLVTSYGISEKVKVYADTVHGFQGDECDIVFFVCNPNNYKYSGHEKALLSKEYIYNVAISRAKDYLVILHPYTAIRNNQFISKIDSSYKNNFGNTKEIHSKEIEKVLFDEENHIENNSYISGHDNVNVFGLSAMKYFIKLNETAIDIQLGSFLNK